MCTARGAAINLCGLMGCVRDACSRMLACSQRVRANGARLKRYPGHAHHHRIVAGRPPREVVFLGKAARAHAEGGDGPKQENGGDQIEPMSDL